MGIPLYQVDAFAEKPFCGNPAAVCLLSGPRPAVWMQSVAREMNLSETAFLERRPGGFGLRWFTPALEVELCGHATLASAHVLWERADAAPREVIRFHTRSGVLTARRRGNSIELDFPAEPPEAAAAPAGLLEALTVRPKFFGRNRLDYLVEVDSESTVREAKPDFPLLKNATADARGVVVTSRSDSSRYDFVSRYFAPAAGIDEDPVTGSTHCCLGPFWAERLGKKKLSAYQASERGGVLQVRVGEGRVYLGGQAVTVLRGELLEGEAADAAL